MPTTCKSNPPARYSPQRVKDLPAAAGTKEDGMGEENNVDRQLSRDQFLRRAAVAGGAVLVPGALASAANALTTESGRLQVLDWAGYGNDGGQSMFAQYVRTHPQNKPQFTY